MFALLVARGLILAVPLRHWQHRLSGDPAGTAEPDAAALRRSYGIGRQVERIADAFPVHLKCLPRAMAAAAMLRRRGIASRLVIGACRGTGGIELHAWLMVGRLCVVGSGERARYRVLTGAGHSPPGD